ncbi:MAG: hypothetical protein Q8M31_23555 [Beijerinckiaceae bacterium]|nr:hypothetical protein [Beijerinckiaceae bacterium]
MAAEVEKAIAELERVAAISMEAARRLRAELESRGDKPRWLPLKGAAREVQKSEKVVWLAAKRSGAALMHGKRCTVDMNKLPLKAPPAGCLRAGLAR